MSDANPDESVEEEIDDESEEESSEPSGRFGGMRRLIIIAAAAVLLLSGGGAGAYFSGLLDPYIGVEKQQPETPNVVFFDLPEMVVNLEAGAKKQSFLKIQLSLELDESQDLAILQNVLPRVIDQFHIYLRELRVADLQGSAGIFRVKDELLRRVSAAAHPVEIRDVLFKEMLIQ
ncbi:MAG: flagellar basal body-associated FliL family protein [Alphaproteobacteria bacterium]